MCDELYVNQACLIVESSYAEVLNLYTQSSECYGCPLQQTAKIRAFANKSVPVESIHPLQFELRHRTDGVLPNCSYVDTLGEHGSYLLKVSSSGECSRETIEDPVNIYYPLLAAAGTLLGLLLLWHFARHIYFRVEVLFSCPEIEEKVWFIRSFGGPSSYTFGSQQDVLGSTYSVDTNNGAVQEILPPPPKRRLRSLDTFRGLSLVLMVFVNYGGGKYWFFRHARWNGLHLADLVFPWFVWIMGVSMAMSVRSLLRNSVAKHKIFLKALKRSAILFGLGITLNSAGGNNDLSSLRITGVLQRLAISYLATCSLHLVSAKPHDSVMLSKWVKLRDILFYWPEWMLMMLLLVLSLCLTFLLEVPGCGRGYLGPGGLHLNGTFFNCTGGAAGYIDRVVLGEQHMYPRFSSKVLYGADQRYDPEGILGNLTSIFLVFLGLQAGKILLSFLEWKPRLGRWCAWGIACGLLGGVLCTFSKEDGWIPVNKNLWSLSYVLAMAGTAFLLLSLLYYIIDVRCYWSGAPFTYPGMNSIAVYVGHDLVHGMFPWFWKCCETHWCYLFMNLWGTSLWVLAAYLMHRKGLFIAI